MIGIVARAIGQDICVKFTENLFLHEWRSGDEDARGRRNDDKRGEAADYRDDLQEEINARNELEKSLQVGSNELPWLITSSRILFFRLAKNSLGQSSRAR